MVADIRVLGAGSSGGSFVRDNVMWSKYSKISINQLFWDHEKLLIDGGIFNWSINNCLTSILINKKNTLSKYFLFFYIKLFNYIDILKFMLLNYWITNYHYYVYYLIKK